ncbi:MAG: Omp28 family outer membrane lipoprotein [Prevotella sp.]|nr:Omp28 family outer membrane lipoprotein [Prevotella sp.]
MKTSHYYIPALAAAVIAVVTAACSNIDEDERFIYVQPAEVAKHVLIEDFTGQACTNCPTAMDIIRDIQEQYGEDNVIAVGIYGGPNGSSTSGRMYPLTTETGNYYSNKYGVSTQPAALIDRHGLTSNYTSWLTDVTQYIQNTSPLIMSVASEYDEQTRTATLSVSALAAGTINATLQVWLTEDGVTDWQNLPDGSRDTEYTHNHVFRMAVNDVDGEAYNIEEGETDERTFTAAIDDDWAAENMSFVAIVAGSSGVIQVEKTSVIPAEEEEDISEDSDETNNE